MRLLSRPFYVKPRARICGYWNYEARNKYYCIDIAGEKAPLSVEQLHPENSVMCPGYLAWSYPTKSEAEMVALWWGYRITDKPRGKMDRWSVVMAVGWAMLILGMIVIALGTY